MAKFNTKNLVVIIIFGILLIGTVAIVNAQQALPKGGDSFGTAVEIEPGSYQRSALEENEYFYLADIKPGQEISVKYTFGAGTGHDGWGILGFYNEDRIELFGEWDTVTEGESESIAVSWLPNTDKDSYKYYIRTGYDDYDVGPISFDISLTNYYDARSQTDAGDSFNKAMNISPGEYKAYLSGEAGTDTKDFYKTAVEKGETLTVKVTPEGEARMRIAVYDNNRQVLKDEYAPNPGAIITNSVARTRSGDVLIAVVCEEWCSENVTAYTLNITKEAGAPVGEEEEEVLTEESTGLPIGEGLTGEEAEEAAKGFFKVVIIAWLLPLVVGLISLVVVIVVIVVLVRKKKK